MENKGGRRNRKGEERETSFFLSCMISHGLCMIENRLWSISDACYIHVSMINSCS